MKIFFLLFAGLLLLSTNDCLAQKAKKSNHKQEGKASYYHPKFNGRKTATGEIFNNQQMTAASNHYPLGSKVKVTNKRTGKSVIVKVNDRMSPNNSRIIDLTERAAKELCFLEEGTCTVIIENSNGEQEEIIFHSQLSDMEKSIDK